MNEELEKQLALMVEKALTVAEKTGDFIIEQAPELIKEFYRWHIAENVFFIILDLVLIFSSIFIFRAIGSKESNSYHDIKFLGRNYESDSPQFIFSILSFVILDVVCLIGIFSCSFDLIKILVSPKLYIIEYFIK